MSTIPPQKFTWDGEVFKPLFPAVADKHFVVDQIYVLSETRERSDESHAHYFACVYHAWANLSDEESEQYPTPEHLRYKALIACGYSMTRQIVLHDARDAIKMAFHLTEESDGYDAVTVIDNVVTIIKPRSQNYKSMKRHEFQKSKEDVIGWCAAKIDMTSVDLARAGSESSKRREK